MPAVITQGSSWTLIGYPSVYAFQNIPHRYETHYRRIRGRLHSSCRHLAFRPAGRKAEFSGYEDWKVVAVSQTADLIEVILANPVMIDAYRAGVPGNGKRFPDGSKLAKIHWKAKKSAEAPAPTTVPGTLHDVDFMVRDSKRFSNSGNWGYAEFDYDPAPDTLK